LLYTEDVYKMQSF